MRIIKKSWLFVNLVIRNTARHDHRDGGSRGATCTPNFWQIRQSWSNQRGLIMPAAKLLPPPPIFYLPLSLNCSAPSRTKGCFLAKAFGFMSARRRSILRRWREFMQKQKCTFYTKKRSFSREKAKHLTVSLYTLCILRNTYWPSSSLYVLCIVSMNDDLVCRRPCLILLTYNLVNGCKRQLVNTDSHLNWKRFKHARRWPHSSYYAAI